MILARGARVLTKEWRMARTNIPNATDVEGGPYICDEWGHRSWGAS
jgi:hypothetical protein